MLRVTERIPIDEEEIEERFVRDGGVPNKVARAVQLPSMPNTRRASTKEYGRGSDGVADPGLGASLLGGTAALQR